MTTYNRDELRNGTLHFGTLRNKRGTALLNGTRYTGKFWGIKSELRFYPDNKALLADGEHHVKLYTNMYNNLIPHTLHSITVDA